MIGQSSPFYFNGLPTTVAPTPFSYINCIIDGNDQHGGLFLGDVVSSKKPEVLTGHNIKAILCCGQEPRKLCSI